MSNRSLHDAKDGKKDEFYTQYEDIEKEVVNYKEHFYGKIVYCNCDTPDSNFVKYFEDNFDEFGLKRLIHTSIQEGVDFRSNESIELLKGSDIVVTNPPFSLFREYVAQLVQYDKKFLIMGNVNAITYKEIFPLLKENKIWLGHRSSGSMSFTVPKNDDYTSKPDYKVNGKGAGIRTLGNCCWFTNLEHKKRYENINLMKQYYGQLGTPEKYPKYDNYDAIEVSRTADIPKDYEGAMGVPITFMDKYNPEQFEILGEANHGIDSDYDLFKPTINGKQVFKRIVIRNRHPSPKE